MLETTTFPQQHPPRFDSAAVAGAMTMAALYPFRMTLYSAFPPSPSRSMAAITLSCQPRVGDDDTTGAGCDASPCRRTRPRGFSPDSRNATMYTRVAP